MSLFSTIRQDLDVGLLVAFLGAWFLAKQRGKKIQEQKIQLQKQAGDSTLNPLLENARELDKQLEAADADRLAKEARLDARLHSIGKSRKAGP